MAQDENLPCPGRGFGSQYLVPNAHTAEAIYRAIANAVYPNWKRKYPIVVVSDAGDHWEVGQKNNDPPPKSKPGEIVVTAGGGQFGISIDKCTAAIPLAALNR